jgi:hypothetical protein
VGKKTALCVKKLGKNSVTAQPVMIAKDHAAASGWSSAGRLHQHQLNHKRIGEAAFAGVGQREGATGVRRQKKGA